MMCGFIQRVTDSPAVRELLEELGLKETISRFDKEKKTSDCLKFYPAFGNAVERKLTNMIITNDQAVDATWWYDAVSDGSSIKLGSRTTFNARNLESPYWKSAIAARRGIVIATGVGESNQVGKSKEHYLMKSRGAMLIGTVYQAFPNGLYSAAVITRPPHPRFSRYHEKSIPCFLPPDRAFINTWLNGAIHDPVIQDVLNVPRIYNALEVRQVKTFKGGQPISESEMLKPDDY